MTPPAGEEGAMGERMTYGALLHLIDLRGTFAIYERLESLRARVAELERERERLAGALRELGSDWEDGWCWCPDEFGPHYGPQFNEHWPSCLAARAALQDAPPTPPPTEEAR